MRAAAWMNSTECGEHAGVLPNEIDATLQIIAAEKDVIEHRRHLVNERGIVRFPLRLLSNNRGRGDHSGCGEL